jgi:GNAT superfamily N-acetyltransferase
MFECIDNTQTAKALLDAACSYHRQESCTSIIGPVNLSTNDESGFLLEGYEHRPTFMCGYSLPYYHSLVEEYGFSKLVDTLAYETHFGHVFPNKYYRAIERAVKNSHIRIRRFNRRTSARDIQQIRDVYNESFMSTWGFVPMSEDEAQELGEGLLQFADLDLVWVADYDERPVGFILGFPDLNEILRHSGGKLGPLTLLRILLPRWSMHNMRVAAFGVLPAYRTLGIESALIWRVHERINSRPYRRIEFSVVMANNRRMRRLLESIGFALTKRYRLYGMEL